MGMRALETAGSKSTADINREMAASLSNNLSRLLREFSRDFERRIWQGLVTRGYHDIRPSHSAVLANLGLGAVRVTELAERGRVTQQAMGKMLKELERLGYVTREVDRGDRRAREIKLTPRGEQLAADNSKVVAEVRAVYSEKVGAEDLDLLESLLRSVVSKLDLDYLPASWLDAAPPTEH
jgi:DNA-binding MarR family transcriptional regulator